MCACAPLADRARVACAGGNFADHAEAMALKLDGKSLGPDPGERIRRGGFWGFWKLNREFAGPDDEVVYPDRCNRLDYESEIAVVLSKRGCDLK